MHTILIFSILLQTLILKSSEEYEVIDGVKDRQIVNPLMDDTDDNPKI